MLNQEISSNAVKGLFILFLVIVANFLGTTLNCEIQRQLETSVITRNIAIFFLIYFTINFYSDPASFIVDQIKTTVIIFFLFIFLMKQQAYFFLFNLIVIIVIFINSQTRDYYEKRNQKEKVTQIEFTNYILKIFLILSLSVGFMVHLYNEVKDKNGHFHILKFLFGNNKCS